MAIVKCCHLQGIIIIDFVAIIMVIFYYCYYHSLVCITVRGGGEVDLHDHLELSLVAAVLEDGVVVVAAEHIRLVV